MTIHISEIRNVTLRLLDALENNGQETFSIDKDYYWHISKTEKYNMDKEPADFTVGQLTDDINELRKIAKGEREESVYALVWLAQVLSYIGEGK